MPVGATQRLSGSLSKQVRSILDPEKSKQLAVTENDLSQVVDDHDHGRNGVKHLLDMRHAAEKPALLFHFGLWRSFGRCKMSG
jgi:hypothetical protein